MSEEARAAFEAGARLSVGVAHRPPYAIRTPGGRWQGIGVDLWRMTAEELGLEYEWVEAEPAALVDGLATGLYDVALPVDATVEAEERVDLTPAFFTATLGIAGRNSIDVWAVAKSVLSWKLFRVVLALSVLLLVVGAIMWVLERRENDEQFGGGTMRGLGDGFWWAGVTLTTIGYGDKAPVTLAGRAVAMVWMLVGLGITAALTATIVAATGLDGQGRASDPQDLQGMVVGALPDTASAAYLESAEIDFRSFETPAEGLRAVEAERIDAFVASAPILRSTASAERLDVDVSTTDQDVQLVAFAVPQDSPLREPLARAVLGIVTDGGWGDLVTRHLQEG